MIAMAIDGESPSSYALPFAARMATLRTWPSLGGKMILRDESLRYMKRRYAKDMFQFGLTGIVN